MVEQQNSQQPEEAKSADVPLVVNRVPDSVDGSNLAVVPVVDPEDLNAVMTYSTQTNDY